MARIPVYNNTVFPDAGPMAEAARSAGFAGRQIGSSLQEGFNALESGVRSVQAGFEKRAKEKEEHEARIEINNLTVAAAKLDAQLAVEWQQTLASADPNDPTVAERFVNDRVTPAWEAIGANLKTERGRMHFATQRAQAWASAYKGAHSDQAAIAAQQAAQNVEDMGTLRSDAAYTQPATWQEQVAAMERDVDAIAETNPGTTVVAREKLKDKLRKDIVEGALRKLIATNPDEALRAIEGGDFKGILSGEEMGIQAERARSSKNSLDNDAKQALKDAEQAKKDLATAEFDAIRAGVEFDPVTKTMKFPADYETRLRDWETKHGTYADGDKLRTEKNYIAVEKRRNPDDDVVSDPEVKERLRKRALAGEDITDDVRNARMMDLLDAEDTSTLLEWGKSNDNPKEDNKYLEGFLETQHSYIGVGRPGTQNKPINDAWAKSRIADYNKDMTKKYKEAKALGWTDEQFEEYAKKALPRYDFSLRDLDKEMRRARKAKEDFIPPEDIAAPPLVEKDTMPTDEDFDDTSGVEELNRLYQARGQVKSSGDVREGPRKNIVVKTVKGRQPLDFTGLKTDVLDKWERVQGELGYKLPIVSAYRDPVRNARAGGAKKSQHLHGNAIDVDASGLSKAERLHVIRVARRLGFTGVGVYANALHFDIGGTKRAWGPSHSADSIPTWALATVQGT